MYYETTELTEGYTRGDSCYAIITSRDRKGSYLELDNGQGGYAYGVVNLKSGTKILCTITRAAIPAEKPTARTRVLARLDSICDLYERCA